MIPADPSSPDINSQLITHLRTLQSDFAKFDTANETVHGKPWFGGGPDHIVSKEDLQSVVADDKSRFSRADVEAARFFLDHPEALAHLDTASAAGAPETFYDQPDGRVGEQDVHAALRDAENFEQANTFAGQKPSIPTDDRTPEQDAAFQTMLLRGNTGVTVDPGAGTQSFVDTLKAHQGDGAWLQGYFRALGAKNAGSLLYDSLTAGGPDRDEARQALQTLQGGGFLNDTDLDQAQFKTSPQASNGFSLRTLVDADHVQQAVEARRAAIAGSDSQPVDTAENNAYDALLTVRSPHNQAKIDEMAKRYGIDPALLGGVVASEMDFDYNVKDELQDGFWRNSPLHVNVAPGITSVRTDALKWGADYLKQHGAPGADAAAQFIQDDPTRNHGADFDNSVEAAAVVLAALTDVRRSNGASTSTPTDMAVTWGAFRSGIRDVMPGGSGYSLDEFLHNRLDPDDAGNVVAKSGDPHALVGGNAYQSEPYFDTLQRDG
jgi:hypothetical protein